MESELTGWAWDLPSYQELQTLLLFSQLAGSGPGDQGLARSEKRGELGRWPPPVLTVPGAGCPSVPFLRL